MQIAYNSCPRAAFTAAEIRLHTKGNFKRGCKVQKGLLRVSKQNHKVIDLCA